MAHFVLLQLISFLLVFSFIPFVSPTCFNETIMCGDMNLSYPFGVAEMVGVRCGDPDFQVYNCTTLNPYIVIRNTTFYIRNVSLEPYSPELVLHLGIQANALDTNMGCFDFSILKSTLDIGHGSILYFENKTDSFFLDKKQVIIVNCSQVNNKSYNHLCDSWYITFLPLSSNSFCNSISIARHVRVSWTKAQFEFAGIDLLNTEGFVTKAVVNTQRYRSCIACWNKSLICGFDVADYSVQCFGVSNQKTNKGFRAFIRVFPAVITVLVTGGAVTTVILAILLRKRRRQGFEHQKSLPLLPIFSYQQVRAATNSFSDDNKIGSGGFGAVYKGTLSDHRKVAVKRLYRQQTGAMDEFLNEAGIFCQVQHPNIVRLYGFSNPYHSSGHEFLLVFEYISNGTLADHLYGSRKAESRLTWDVRIKIAIQIAEALAFLHAMQPPLLHRDVKSSNILLDDGMEAKVADFGICKEMAVEATHVTTAPRGTPGYLDPQYYEYFQLTDKSDVYSFGVVLLEIVSGLKAVDFSRTPAEYVNLVGLVKSKWGNARWTGLKDVIDPQLREHMAMDPKANKMLMQITLLACKCVASDKDERPSMKDAANLMQELWTKDELRESLGFPSSVTEAAVFEKKPFCTATWETSCVSGR